MNWFTFYIIGYAISVVFITRMTLQWTDHKGYYWTIGDSGPHAIFVSLFWPVTALAFFGMYLGKKERVRTQALEKRDAQIEKLLKESGL